MADNSNMTVSLTIKVQGRDASAELAKVNAALKSTGAEVGKVTQSNKAAAASSSALSSGFKDLALSIVGVVSAGKALAFFRQTVNELDDLRDMSLKTGIAIERLAAIDTIARKAGSSAESITSTFRFINKVIEEAAQGSEDAERAFKKLGTTWEDFYRLTDEERLYSIIAGLEKLGTGAAGAKTAQTLLGRSYQDLIPLIKEYGIDLEKAVDEEAKNRKGIKESADAADGFNDALVDLNTQLKALVNKDTIDGFKTLAEAAVWAVKQIAGLGDALGTTAGTIAALAEGSSVGSNSGPTMNVRTMMDGYINGDGEDVKAKQQQMDDALAAHQDAVIARFAEQLKQEGVAEAEAQAAIDTYKLEAKQKSDAELAKKAEEARQQELESIMDWAKQVEQKKDDIDEAGARRRLERRLKEAMEAGATEAQMVEVLAAATAEAEEQIMAIREKSHKAELENYDKIKRLTDEKMSALKEYEEENLRIMDKQSELAAAINSDVETRGDFFDGLKSGSREFRQSIGSDFEQGKRMMIAGLDSIADNSARAFSGIIDGSMSASAAFRNFAASVLQDISQMIIKMMVLQAVESAIGFAGPALGFGGFENPLGPGGEIGSGVSNDRGLGSGGGIAMSRGAGGNGTVVIQNYNISAVDQSSVAKLFASPEFQRSQRAAQANNDKRNTMVRSSRR